MPSVFSLQLPWQQNHFVTLLLSLLFQLIHQFLPFGGKQGMLFTQLSSNRLRRCVSSALS